MKYSTEDVAQAKEELADLKPGDTVYTILRRVSRSGMQREIGVVQLTKNGPRHPNWAVAVLLGLPLNRSGFDGVKVGGCGMDMGFHLVYSLSAALFPGGFGVEGELPLGRKIRPTSPENAALAIARGAKFYGRNGDASGWDNDGGYALRHEWL